MVPYRKIIWFNPPFNKAVKTKIGAKFLEIVKKHFPAGHRLHPILNKNTVKISYSCMPNIRRIIQAHNSKLLRQKAPLEKTPKECTCRKKSDCPLENKCNRQNVIYKATTQDEKTYIGVAKNFKKRYYSHKDSFRHEDKKNATALSEHIWKQNLGNDPKIKWEIIATAQPYKTGQKACQLCLTEKLKILEHTNSKDSLNKRSEIAQKCRHKLFHTLAKTGSEGVG